MSGMDRLTEAAWADLLAESLQVATAQNGSRNASRLLKDYRDHCANRYTPSETTPSDKLSDEALDRAVRMTDSHTTVGMMARELLDHRRASQAAPSDGLREAAQAIVEHDVFFDRNYISVALNKHLDALSSALGLPVRPWQGMDERNTPDRKE